MTARGHVQNGVIVLDSPFDLQEGAEVEVSFLSDLLPRPEPLAGKSDAEKAEYQKLHPTIQRLAGILPEDFDWKREREAYLLEKYGPF